MPPAKITPFTCVPSFLHKTAKFLEAGDFRPQRDPKAAATDPVPGPVPAPGRPVR
ncbi:hypothetical protein GCM10020370_44920 [Paenibacillus hodogayensis]